MVTKKQFLLNQLANEHWALVLALAAVKLFRTPEAIALLPGSSVEWGGRRLDLNGVAATLVIPAEATLVLNQFLKVHMRAFIRDSFENIKAHCKAHLASAHDGVTVLGSNQADKSVTVLGKTRVQLVGCE